MRFCGRLKGDGSLFFLQCSRLAIRRKSHGVTGRSQTDPSKVGQISSMPEDEPVNLTIETRKKQLLRFKQDSCYRNRIEKTWANIEPVYRMAELYRMNLAKHAAPGKDSVIPRSPGYGRINRWCGSLDNELIDKDGHYVTMNRRDIAEGLRAAIEMANRVAGGI